MPNHTPLGWISIAMFLVALSGICPNTSDATKRALLVGVGDYTDASITDLQGPPHDVAALQTVLTTQPFGFAAKHITALVDGQATRRQILQELEALRNVSQAGDFLLIYFSGHGTSAFDFKANLPLPHNTGAFLPVDFAADGSLEEKMHSLVIGVRDIRPILMAIDQKGVTGMILIDSCYSQNTSRAIYASGRQPVYRSHPAWLEHLDSPFDAEPEAKQPYPYRHLVTLTASSAKEPAIDEVNIFQTLDGKPHGAFTDGLLRTLGDIGRADANHDGTVTNRELLGAVKTRLSQGNYPQSPQLLPLHTEDRAGIEDAPIFGGRVTLDEPEMPLDAPVRLRVQVQGTFPRLIEVINQTEALSLASEPYDLRVARVGGAIHLLTAFGDSVIQSDNPGVIEQALHGQIWIKQLVGTANAAQRFQIDLRMDGYCGETFESGDIFGVSVSMDQQAYLLLVDVAPNGSLRVLYPFYPRELDPVPARQLVQFGGIHVTEPFGIDHVIAVGFIEKPPAYNDRLLKGHFQPGTHRHRALQALLQADNDPNLARQVVKVVTVPRRSPGAKNCNG